MNKMENSVTPSPSCKAVAAANLKAFATVTHAVALQNRSNLKATFNSNHDLLQICSPHMRETDVVQGKDE